MASREGNTRLGGVGSGPQSPSEWGTVTAVQADKYTYTVKTLRGTSLYGVPRMRLHPSDTSLLPSGTSVVLRWDLGVPVIDGCLDQPANVATGAGIAISEVEGIGGQGLDQSNDPGAGSARGNAEPTDGVPGDWMVSNRSGALLAVLEGAVALLKGGQLAQVRAHGLNDTLELISRNFRQVTDLGVSEVKNVGGRVNWSFRGASDQLNEAGSDEENWTMRMDLGAVGDLFNFELTTPQGQTLFKLHVDANGRVEIYGLDGVITHSGAQNGEAHETIQEGDVRSAVGGDVETEVGGDMTTTVEGSRTETTDGSVESNVGTDHAGAVGRDVGYCIGRNGVFTITGARDNTDALTVKVPGGNMLFEVGDVTSPMSGATFKTQKGAFKVESSSGGNIELKTLLGELRAQMRRAVLITNTPDSVILGGNSSVGHVAIYERLEQLLIAMMRVFDSHTHTAPGGTTAVPIVGMTASLRSLINSIKSQRVCVGG